jgi:hypothetical protein
LHARGVAQELLPSCGALANEARVALDGPPLSLKLEPMAAAPSHVVLAGRATSVPFTAAITGPKRTATDNTTSGITCVAPRWLR